MFLLKWAPMKCWTMAFKPNITRAEYSKWHSSDSRLLEYICIKAFFTVIRLIMFKNLQILGHIFAWTLIFFHGCDASRCGAWLIALHQRLAQVKLKWPLFLKSFLLGAGRGLRNTSVESCVPSSGWGRVHWWLWFEVGLSEARDPVSYVAVPFKLMCCKGKGEMWGEMEMVTSWLTAASGLGRF